MMARMWKSRDGEIAVFEMESSYIRNAVRFLHRRAAEYRAQADMGIISERRADSYLEWAFSWLEEFEAELKRREVVPSTPIDRFLFPNNDQSVQSGDVQRLLAHPEDYDDD